MYVDSRGLSRRFDVDTLTVTDRSSNLHLLAELPPAPQEFFTSMVVVLSLTVGPIMSTYITARLR